MNASVPVALIADDDEFFRIALSTLLRSNLAFGDVIETASLDDALRALAEHCEIALALFDLDMPGMRGAASLSAVRACFPGLRTAVVSASQNRRDILLALEAGAHGYVPKGLGATELSRALAAIFSGTVYVPPSIAELDPADGISGEVPPLWCPEPDQLTPLQQQVLHLVVQGKSNREIARLLELGEGTVKVHMATLFRVLGVSTRAGAVAAGAEIFSGGQ